MMAQDVVGTGEGNARGDELEMSQQVIIFGKRGGLPWVLDLIGEPRCVTAHGSGLSMSHHEKVLYYPRGVPVCFSSRSPKS